MTTSLASCADTGVSLPRTDPFDDPRLRAPQNPGDGCLADFVVRNKGFIHG